MAGRPQGSKMIVPVEEILDATQMKSETWRLVHLLQEISTVDECLKWLARRRLLQNTVQCSFCAMPASFVHCYDSVDKYRWSCGKCKFRQSVRKGSFFFKSSLTLRQILLIIYLWASEAPQKTITHEAEISKRVAIDWSNFCRVECEKFVKKQSNEIGGMDEDGNPIVVEINESKLFRRKYRKGQCHDGHWVFSGIERESGKCFLVEIPDLKADTLRAEIERHILPGTRIVSDGWAAYANIASIHDGIYIHDVIIDEEHCMDLDNSLIQKQNVTNMCLMGKRKLARQCGTSPDLFQSYLHEFVFRNLFRGENIFANFLVCVGDNYPVSADGLPGTLKHLNFDIGNSCTPQKVLQNTDTEFKDLADYKNVPIFKERECSGQ